MKSKEGSLEWSSLNCDLHPWLKQAIISLGFQTMTPVQASTIPLFSGNKDVIVEAVTGSGKTLSFVIPVLQKVSNMIYENEEGQSIEPLKKGHMLAIIMAPTRELAQQIQAVFKSVLQFLPENLSPIKTQLLLGALSNIREDVESFLNERPQILIASPGRLLDFLSSNYVKTKSVEIVVLDEADRLLDISFSNDVITILKQLPKQRRTGLFSATISSAGDNIFRTGISNPVKIAVKSKRADAAPSSLNINYMVIDPEKKITSMIQILKDYRFKKCIVYFGTGLSVKHFYNVLKTLVTSKNNILQFFSIHGSLSTKSRLKTIQSFTDKDTHDHKSVLLTTDVAARGIDIPDVDLVIQVDPPNDPDVFVHRSGRTGRANKSGRAIVMLNENSREIDYVQFMEVKKILMEPLEPPKYMDHEAFTKDLRKYMLNDRARNELAVKGFVGFVRHYSKHVVSSIFRLQNLDYIKVAKSYGLLRLPKMPELKYVPADIMPEDGWLGEKIDMDRYAYKNSDQEKQRLENLESEKESKINDAKRRKELKIKNESWSLKTDLKEAKKTRKEKVKRKREQIEKQLQENSSDEKDDMGLDWKDLVRSNKKQRGGNGPMQGSFDDL